MKKEGLIRPKFRPLTVVLPIEKIMKEAIRMVLESIYYDPEFPENTSHHATLRRIKEEWGTSPSKRVFLQFNVKSSQAIDRHRLIPILKEEIDDPKFFYSIHKVLGGEKGPCSVPHSVLLATQLGNIYLRKLDQEIRRIQQKYEIPIAQRIRSVTSRIDDQETSGEESFNAPQDNKTIIVDRASIQRKEAAFHSLVSSWHTLPASTYLRARKRAFRFPFGFYYRLP